MRSTNLGIIFCVAGVEGDSLVVEPAVEVDGGDNVLERGHDALDGGDVLLFESQGGSGGGGLRGRRGRASNGAAVGLRGGDWF